MREGWKCPNCGGAHGPHVDSCPVASAKPTPSSPEPVYPGSWQPSPIIPLTAPREWYPAPTVVGDPPPMWPHPLSGFTCKVDPNLIVVN